MLKLSLCYKIKQKGAMFIEYAVVLAFVIVVGALFISDNSMKNSITSIFGKAEDTLEVAVNGGKKYRGDFKEHVSNIRNNKYTSNSSGKGWAYSNVYNEANGERKQQFVWIPDNAVITDDGKVYAMAYLTWYNDQHTAQYAIVSANLDATGNLVYNTDNTIAIIDNGHYSLHHKGEEFAYNSLIEHYDSLRK